jgi:hypothetical protein
MIAYRERFDNFFHKLIWRKQVSILHHPINRFVYIDEMKQYIARNDLKLDSIEKICFYPAPERGWFFGAINTILAKAYLHTLRNFIFGRIFNVMEKKINKYNQKVVYTITK